MRTGNPSPRLLFLVPDDWHFCSHRLPLARAAKEAGFAVTVATRVRNHAEEIHAAGLDLIALRLSRGGRNPFRELRSLAEIAAVYRTVRPDIVHHVTIKPVIYGSVAARLTGVPCVVNALAGLGYVYSSRDLRARLLRPFVGAAYRRLLASGHGRLIVQNPDDLDLLAQRGLVARERAVLIRGAGVDTVRFAPAPEPPGDPVVILPARLVRDKGVEEFVQAASSLRRAAVRARFALVGDPDPENPATVRDADLARWAQEGVVECWGWQQEMADVYHSSSIVCLPSYREGLPKALLEAAACGRAIVTCDVPGCREVVRDGDNGLLVPARDSGALARALRRLIEDASLRARMGKRSRERAVAEFSVERVISETIAVYTSLLRE